MVKRKRTRKGEKKQMSFLNQFPNHSKPDGSEWHRRNHSFGKDYVWRCVRCNYQAPIQNIQTLIAEGEHCRNCSLKFESRDDVVKVPR